ncbi:MAG: beta-N-acetylhexosaminidase [Xanthobacteraceae bacterium]|nr:MAG: beta-N-acetylhexosaminidase [Xanthobacteraceae bacterium]
MVAKAFIAGIQGPNVTAEERAFIRGERPWGFILFKRNIDTPDQVKDLVVQLREATAAPEAPVLIDQEGGRVQRLAPPHWPVYPPGRTYADLYDRDPSCGLEAARLGARLIAADLSDLGITVDCLPLADVPVAGADAIIGDRAYGTAPAKVAAIARAVAEGLADGGVLPVLKHIPGHGRATADSHLRLPVVETGRDELDSTDFAAFRPLADLPMAMTAHVVFSAIDAAHPATTSATMISQVIRGAIGFRGLLMSDDVSMNALQGSIADRTRALFAAGCDIALHCNGRLDEMREVAANTPVLAGTALARATAALAARRQPAALAREAARARFTALLGRVASGGGAVA